MRDERSGEPQRVRHIGETICRMERPKSFRCYESRLTTLCRARDVALKSHLEYLEKQSERCSFPVPLGHAFYCRCAVRIYVANALGK